MEIDEKPLETDEESAPYPVTSAEHSPVILDPSPAPMATICEPTPERPASSEVFMTWLTRSASLETRKAYARDVQHFIRFLGMNQLEQLVAVRPMDVIAWRDHLQSRGLANASVGRKITVLRSLFTFLNVHGITSMNPAHRDFVATPPVPRDGKTVALSPQECRRLLDAPDLKLAVGIRDRAMFAVLAYTGCRVGELCRLRVGDYKLTAGHRVLEIRGKGGKERRIPLHPEAFERIEAWLDHDELRKTPDAALFRPARSARGNGQDGFHPRHLTPRSVQLLVARYVRKLALDPAVTVHSFRVTALTTARECGCDIVAIQSLAGHSDPNTTLTYIRNRDRLSDSPAYVLKYGEPSPPVAHSETLT